VIAFPFPRNAEIDVSSYDFVARMSAGITTKGSLLTELKSKLRFPQASGDSWDALEDRLADLSWLQKQRIALVHDAAPHLSRSDLAIYLTILHACVAAHAEERRAFTASFPEQTRALLDAWTGANA
jgi:hypothetical protein